MSGVAAAPSPSQPAVGVLVDATFRSLRTFAKLLRACPNLDGLRLNFCPVAGLSWQSVESRRVYLVEFAVSTESFSSYTCPVATQIVVDWSALPKILSQYETRAFTLRMVIDKDKQLAITISGMYTVNVKLNKPTAEADHYNLPLGFMPATPSFRMQSESLKAYIGALAVVDTVIQFKIANQKHIELKAGGTLLTLSVTKKEDEEYKDYLSIECGRTPITVCASSEYLQTIMRSHTLTDLVSVKFRGNDNVMEITFEEPGEFTVRFYLAPKSNDDN